MPTTKYFPVAQAEQAVLPAPVQPSHSALQDKQLDPLRYASALQLQTPALSDALVTQAEQLPAAPDEQAVQSAGQASHCYESELK